MLYACLPHVISHAIHSHACVAGFSHVTFTTSSSIHGMHARVACYYFDAHDRQRCPQLISWHALVIANTRHASVQMHARVQERLGDRMQDCLDCAFRTSQSMQHCLFIAYANHVILAIFTLEMFIKMQACGFLRYFRKGWHYWLDVFLILIEVMQNHSSGTKLSKLRLLRVRVSL